MENMEMISFELILHSGNARSLAMEAIILAKENNFIEADMKLEEAGAEIALAHKVQTSLIQKEANNEKIDVSILLIHAQDHLMTALTVKELASEFVDLYKRIK